MRISVTLIVKDEQLLLDRCLSSVRGAVDEIVVVDTGSSDSTKAIAQRYTDRVFDFTWCSDFAAARQCAFDHATGDWVAWLDADDVVVGAEHIRALAATAPADIGALYWRYVTGRDRWGNALCEFWRERCVRNDGNFRWSGPVHEVLVPQRPCGTRRCSEVVVEHRPSADHGQRKGRRNLDILERQYAESGNDAPARLLYYLGREYMDHGECDRALEVFAAYVRRATWDDERYLAHCAVADLHRMQGRYEDAIDANLQALKVHPRWPQAHFALAKTYYFLRDWPKVAAWTELAQALPVPDTLQIVHLLEQRFGWIIYYTNALYHLGAIDEALRWTRRALEICPDDPWHRQNFALFARLLRSPDAVAEPSATGAAHG